MNKPKHSKLNNILWDLENKNKQVSDNIKSNILDSFKKEENFSEETKKTLW